VTIDDQDWLAERFEANRAHLRGVAFRMLGSLTEADDAVQEAWIRLSRTDASRVDNLQAWLTTIVGRVCLNMLRSRTARREASLETHFPDLVLSPQEGIDPEQEALLGESVGLAMLVVLDSLTPAERVAFVLHDVFAVPFDEIAPIIDRSPDAARQLASRARRRVRGATPPLDADPTAQREAVDAFIAAARDGDFDALVAVLDPDVVLRADGGTGVVEIRGASKVAGGALSYSQLGLHVRPALVNGVAGAITTREGQLFSISAFTVSDGKIVEIDILADPERLARLDLVVLDG
jgi:RNA polymerase sigma factor (sigma-70 family)